MNIDWAAQDRQNIEHVDNPVPGDVWRERLFCFVCKVVAVGPQHVAIQKWNGPEIMTRRAFAKWLRYSTIPKNTWADCLPYCESVEGT